MQDISVRTVGSDAHLVYDAQDG